MDGILDDTRLDGVFDVGTALRPLRHADLVPSGDMTAFMAGIERHCQTWGGGGTVLVPSADGQLPQPYEDELVRSDIDALDTSLFDGHAKAPEWINHRAMRPYSALLIAEGMKDRRDWWPFRVAALEQDDPWRPIYAATMGLLPTTPSPELFPSFAYEEPPESFDLFFDVERESVTGSLDDLIERLTGKNRNWPRTLSLLGLSGGMPPNNRYTKELRLIPRPDETRTAAGPNIIVVFGKDPVADAALLWNLRGAHTSAYALPIGIPQAQVNRDALAKLRKPGLFAHFGSSGGETYLTSTSVPPSELAQMVTLLAGHETANYDMLLSFGPAPSIPHNQVATFSQGRARLVPETEADNKLIYPFGPRPLGPELQLDVIVDKNYVPTSKTLRGESFGPRFTAGSAQIQIPGKSLRRTRSVEVEWPTPWLRLQCVAKDRGLEVEVSEPGHAALALIDALGGIDEIRWLAHPGLTKLLYKLAERSGMAWWKDRWTDARQKIDSAGIEAEAFEKLAQAMGRDDPTVAPTGEGREMVFQKFVEAFGHRESAAAHWIQWAERCHLVVRGANVRCDKCRARSWIPIAAVPPTVVTCVGCGRPIEHPFPPRQLQFTYRLGEVLRRAMEMDCLDHLFALRYFHTMFQDRGLVGIHPGLNFREKGAQNVSAEADVLLLFADAQLVPGEVKRTGAGITPEAVDKLRATADRLNAPWSFLALGQPARECQPNVHSAQDPDSAQPRLVITTDQTFADHPHWLHGKNPFAWEPIDQEEEDQRTQTLVSYLQDHSPDDPWTSQGSQLLHEREYDVRSRATSPIKD